jgi:hypothetical protein
MQSDKCSTKSCPLNISVSQQAMFFLTCNGHYYFSLCFGKDLVIVATIATLAVVSHVVILSHAFFQCFFVCFFLW